MIVSKFVQQFCHIFSTYWYPSADLACFFCFQSVIFRFQYLKLL